MNKTDLYRFRACYPQIFPVPKLTFAEYNSFFS